MKISTDWPRPVPTLLAALAIAAAAGATPVTGHPRLWLTAADQARLTGWAVSTNPIFQNGLGPLAVAAKADMDAGSVPGLDGGSSTYEQYPTEMYAEVFAFMSLISSDPATRDDYAQRARTCLMYVMNIAVLGQDPSPFRWFDFATSDRSRWHGEGFALTVDWIYPYLTASDKATIQTVFVRWCNENLNANTTTDNHPTPVGVVNDPVLISDPIAVRWSANNYYTAHMRNIALMSMALDPADDPGGALGAFLSDATGAWLYVVDHQLRTDSRGGLAPEGFEYSPQSAGYVVQTLLGLHTSGQDDPTVWGPQVVLTGNPFWDDVVPAYLHSLSPQAITYPAPFSYLGPLYQPAWYGACQNYWNPDFIQEFGPLAIYDDATGNAPRLDALRWIETNDPPGGPTELDARAYDYNYFQDAIFYFMMFDPAAPPAADPHPNVPLTLLAPGLGRLFARTGWDTAATWVDYSLGWNTIDHQSADGNQVELYRNGEWLTKRRTGYDLDYQASDNSNTLSLENDEPARCLTDPSDYRCMLWQRGSQWLYVDSGDPVLAATSFGEDFVYALGDSTNLYNSSSEGVTDIAGASRSVYWMPPDRILLYDRADSLTSGRFKRFWLNLPEQAAIAGNLSTMTLPVSGQQLFVTTLLPAGAAISSPPEPVESSGPPANGETMQYRLLVEDTSGPASIRFRNLLEGADAGASPTAASLVQSSSGTPFDGAAVGHTAVVFPTDLATAFAGTTYSVPACAVDQRITGLTPGAGYDVAIVNMGSTLQVTVSPGGTGYAADSGGVLVVDLPPTMTVTASTCVPGGTAGLTASVPNTAGSTYDWTLSGGTITSGQGTNQITFTSGAPGTLMALRVVATPSASCPSGAGVASIQTDFLDVAASSPFLTFICAIARNGITAGCGAGNFCPGDSVLRSQMAVFLLRGEHGSAYLPPPATGIFGDVPAANPFAPWIEQLYNEGITGGCGTNPLIYCPGNPVSRAGMAVFLLVAEHGTGYSPPACAGIFADVACPGPFTDWIEELYTEGITGGCNSSPLSYCPASSVTREQMAVFLTATFNLP